jgi:hypothetical protein
VSVAFFRAIARRHSILTDSFACGRDGVYKIPANSLGVQKRDPHDGGKPSGCVRYC